MKMLIPLAFMPMLGCLGLAGEGAACKIDSDCSAGLLCTLGGVCATEATVAASFKSDKDVVVITLDTNETLADTVTPSGCDPIKGVFEAGASPCPAAGTIREVANMAILEEGGMAKLSQVGNQVIENAFEDGEMAMWLHIDGSPSATCPAKYVWVVEEADIRDDCTAVWDGEMPFIIPSLVSGRVKRAVYDPATRTLRGIVDEAEIIESMDQALRAIADDLITADVDTDNDGAPDHATVAVEFTFK